MSFKNRRGQTFLDLLLVVVMIFALGIVSILGYKVFGDWNTEFQSETGLSTESKQAAANVNDQLPLMFDRAFLVILVMLWILLVVSSFMIDTHPIFFMVMVIFLIFTFIVGMMLANAYSEIITDSEISTSAASFPLTTWVMEHFLYIIIFMGLSSGVVLYAKSKM